MGDPLEAVASALAEAEQEGFRRGRESALHELGGASAGTRMAQVMADILERCAQRFREEPEVAAALKDHAESLRGRLNQIQSGHAEKRRRKANVSGPRVGEPAGGDTTAVAEDK